MGKDLHYLILEFISKAILNHNIVISYVDITNDKYYKYILKRKNSLSDVTILLDDSYFFGDMALMEAILEIPEGGIVLIAKPEATISGSISIPHLDQNIYIEKIGNVMGALYKEEFWTYEKPKKKNVR